MSDPTPENLRFMTAGYLGAALTLIMSGETKAAKIPLKVVCDYLDLPNVSAPDHLRDMARRAYDAPADHAETIMTLERVFVDPMNTKIENSGGRWLS